ncbi:fibronectin type III domain-containing protein [Micromonospora sp. CPCC 205371]|nr:fibronectin type III domain-containing protein [Micromonospora sp. CPCC 205371]
MSAWSFFRGVREAGRVRSAAIAIILLATGLVVLPGGSHVERGVIVTNNPATAIAGEFLVKFHDTVEVPEVAGRTIDLVAQHGGVATKVFPAFRGFALAASDTQAERIAADPVVDFVERNQRLTPLDTQNTGATPDRPWQLHNLDRIDQRALPGNSEFNHGTTAVPIYIVDDGILQNHEQFGGALSRVTIGFSASGLGAYRDCSGHGTAVASVAAGSTVGVAKQSPIISVRVGCGSSGHTAARVVEGLQYIIGQGRRPAVVNISLGVSAGVDGFVDSSVLALIAAGFTVVMAAGNDNMDACGVTPARTANQAYGAIVVGGADLIDRRLPGSNHGSCVHLWAPAQEVVVANGEFPALYAPERGTGTSLAAPLVSGAAAMILAAHPTFTPAQVKDALLADATPDIVEGVDPGDEEARGRLLYIPPPDQPATATSSDLNELFNIYGNQGGHWTGGDETMSVELPDGRVAWFFGDTMLGTVNSDGTRPPNQPMVHNSVVIQDGNTLTDTLLGGTQSSPLSFVGWEDELPPKDDYLGWWPGEGHVVGDELQVFYTKVKRGSGGPLSFVTEARGIARLSLPDLTPQGLPTKLKDLPLHIGWGTAMVDADDGFTYIYGAESDGATNHLHIARAPQGQVLGSASNPTGAWQFWTGSGWNNSPSTSARTTTGMGTGFSVKRHDDGRYVLVTVDNSQPFTNRVLAFFADKPTGPFIHQTLLYNAPEATGNSYVYNARIHPEQNSSGDFVLSYNVNSLDPADANRDVRRYRPKFIHVKLPPAVNANQLPDAPRNLTASANANGVVSLSWTMPTGSKNNNVVYRIYERNADSGASHFTRPNGTVSSTSTSFGMLTPGVYQFRVTAQNAVGEGPPSLPASVAVVIPKPANAPANLTGTANPDGSVSLSWGPVTAAGWVNYRVYQLDVTGGQSEFTESGSAVIDETTARVTGLTRGSMYDFRVTAFNGGGEGPPSNIVRLTATVQPPPAPTNLVATPNPDGTIGLTWNSSGPGIWYWVSSRNISDDPNAEFTQYEYPVSNGPAFTAAYLTVGDTYEFRVVSFNEGGPSAPSNIARATSAIAPPPAPTNLVATANGDGTIGLNWDSSGPGIWYWVYSRKLSEATFTKSQYHVETTTFTAAFLTVGEQYEFYVVSFNEGGESARSNIVRARSTVAPPPAPTHLTATSNDDGSIALSWRSSGPDIWYWVYSRNVSNGQTTFTKSQYHVENTVFTAGFLQIGDVYEFYVVSFNEGGESARSNTVQASSSIPPPAAPRNLTASAGNSEVHLSWTAPEPGLWYYVYTREGATGPFVRSQYPITSGTTFTAGYLSNGTTYAFYVTAIDTGGESAPSNTVQATPKLPPPPAPTNLTATPQSNGNIRLSWNSSGAGIWYWVYSRNAAGGSYTRSQYPVTNGTTFTAGYLTVGATYSFYVTAFNDGGESPKSNTVQATSTIPPPPAPANLTATALSNGTIRLSWGSSGAGLWYYVYSRNVTLGESFKRSQYPITNGTSFTAGYLHIGHTYAYYVRAINAGGEGPASNTAQAIATIPPPSNVSAVWTEHATGRVSWRSNNNPGGMFYVYVRNVDANQNFERQQHPVSGRNWQSVSPLTGGNYQFYVVELGAHGGQSGPSNIFTLQSTYPLPAAGNVSASLHYSPISCYTVQNTRVCGTTVYPQANLTNWAAAFQSNDELRIDWTYRVNGEVKMTPSAYCQGSGGITSCQRSGPGISVAWAEALGPPSVCVTTEGYAYYYRNVNSTVKVSKTRRDCVTPGAPGG